MSTALVPSSLCSAWLCERFAERDNEAKDAALIDFSALKLEMTASAPWHRCDLDAIEPKHLREQYIKTIKHTRSWKNMTPWQKKQVIRCGRANIDKLTDGRTGAVSWALLGHVIRGENR